MLENNFLVQPNYHWDIIDFFEKELKIGKKYIVLDWFSDSEKLAKMLAKKVNMVVSICNNMGKYNFLKNHLSNYKNISIVNQTTNNKLVIDDDSVDFALLGQYFLNENWQKSTQELERVLRLNSFVVVLIQQLNNDSAFVDAYLQLLIQYNLKDIYQRQDIENQLVSFYKNGFESKNFSSQLRLNAELLDFYLENIFLNQAENTIFKRALKIIFNQYQQNGEVVLNFNTKIYFGLFNKYVPAISLQKNIFFILLKPIAFCFYILVKLNVYFWRLLYKLKFLFTKK